MTALVAFVALALLTVPAMSHHSFAMYDQTKTLVLTGVATRFVAQANHAELHFALIGPDGQLVKGTDGKYVSWGAEMGGAAGMAEQGVTAKSFAPGTVFSIKLNPMRDGSNFGSSRGTIVRCPDKTKPAPGKTCDTVEGATFHGGTAF
jgi:hypothetical protein